MNSPFPTTPQHVYRLRILWSMLCKTLQNSWWLIHLSFSPFLVHINFSCKHLKIGSERKFELHNLNRAQVVGWPPIRSYRKNTMATNPLKSKEEAEAKQGAGCLYVKVSMDGAPYLRKVDLKTYNNYKDLSSALEKMFSGFTIGELWFCLHLVLLFSFFFSFPCS